MTWSPAYAERAPINKLDSEHNRENTVTYTPTLLHNIISQ